VRQALKQGEDVLALIGCSEIVGVFNPALNAAQSGELAQIQGLHQVIGLGFGDFGEYRHGRNQWVRLAASVKMKFQIVGGCMVDPACGSSAAC
jgi:hypothetical protein